MRGGLIALAAVLVGCTTTIGLGGPNGLLISSALMGATTQGTTADRGYEAVTATWGNGMATVDDQGQQIDRRGVSANLRGVLGDGLGLVIADKLLCAIPAVTASCILENGVRRFVGNDELSREEAEELLEAFQALR